MLTTTVNLAGGVAPGTLQYMPAGNHGIDATVNGNPQHREVFVDSAAADRLQADLTEKLAASAAGKAARPCFYFDHTRGLLVTATLHPPRHHARVASNRRHAPTTPTHAGC